MKRIAKRVSKTLQTKPGMHKTRVLQALVFALAIASASPVFCQPSDSAPLNAIQRETLCSYAGDQFLPNMSIVLGFLTVIAAIAIIVPTCLSMFNLHALQKEVREYKIMRKELDDELDKIREKFRDYKAPDEILTNAESKAVRYTDLQVEAIRATVDIVKESIISRLNALERNLPPER